MNIIKPCLLIASTFTLITGCSNLPTKEEYCAFKEGSILEDIIVVDRRGVRWIDCSTLEERPATNPDWEPENPPNSK